MRSVVCRDGTPVPPDADWAALWKLAKKNHLETIVYTAMPPEEGEAVKAEFFRMAGRSVRQEHLLGEIEKALSREGVPYALMKGSVLKYDYPEMHYRFMSDMDLYIRPEDRTRIRRAMESISGSLSGTESGDHQFVFPGGLGVEFHGRLLYRRTKQGIENYPDWSFVDESRNRLTEEGYALNILGHAVYDLSRSGPGIRYILDLWVYRNRRPAQPDWEIVRQRLRADGIERAAQNLLDLSEYLFGSGEETELLGEMADYILAGGLYGDARRGAAAEAAKAGSRAMAIPRQVFRTRTEYENRYPWLKKYPLLLPAAWVMRMTASIRGNRGRIKAWLAGMKTVSKSSADDLRETLTRFGL